MARHFNIALISLIVCLLTCVAATSPAQAQDAQPVPAMTPLDQALDDLQNMEPPIQIAPPPKPVDEVELVPVEEEPAVAESLPEPVSEPGPVKTSEPAHKEPTPPAPLARFVEVQPNSSFLGLSVGMYAPTSNRHKGASLNIEWQPGVKIVGVLRPLFGAFVTTRGAAMGYGGLGLPVHLGKRIVVMPSFSVGGYAHGDGVDLGQALAFRAGGEISYEFDDKSRFGINAHLITNGKSTSKRDSAAIIGLVYTTPTDLLSGRPKPAEVMERDAGKTTVKQVADGVDSGNGGGNDAAKETFREADKAALGQSGKPGK